MTATQVFKWFCKEQGIMANIMNMYHTVHPRYNTYYNGGVQTKYLTYDEYIVIKLRNNNFVDLFERITSDFLFKIGWEKYEEYVDKWNLRNISKKWRYFATNNIRLDENCLKVGDDITFRLSDWRRWDENHALMDTIHRGRVDTLQVGNGIMVIWDYADNRHRTYYSNEIFNRDNGVFDFDLNFYIKRNRRTYYGRNSAE